MTAVFRIMFKLVRFLISPNDRQHVTSLVCLKNVTTLIHYLHEKLRIIFGKKEYFKQENNTIILCGIYGPNLR
jgi:hypothetical protein